MRKLLAVLALSVFGFPAAANADCGEVSITQMNWASSAIVTEVSKFIMENGYGCDVTVVPSDTVPAVTSVAETGEPDIVTELWLNSAPSYTKLEEQGKVKTLGDVLSDGGIEAWWVPAYLAEKHPELKTIEGVLANPDKVGGRFHNCPDGWGCRTINDNNLEALGMEDHGIEVFNHGSGETLAASIASAYEDEAPWFGYYWAPTALLGKYDMVKVDVGPYNEDAHSCNTREDCQDPGVSAYPASKVVTGVTTDFADREPQIAELMSKVSFTNNQMGTVLAWQDANQASAEEAAVYFLNNYKKAWSGWLNDEASQELASVLQ